MNINNALNSFSERILEYAAKLMAPESVLAQARGEVNMSKEE